MARTLVVGLGNRERGDDAAGVEVARLVQDRTARGDLVVAGVTEPAALLDLWEGATSVIVVDAASGPAPGTVHRIDARRDALPATLCRTSSHAFGLAEVVELARILDLLPPSLVVYAIEGRSFHAGAGLSPEVEGALAGVVAAILRDVAPDASSRAPGRITPTGGR